jgi:hypothetical protein
MTMEIPMLEIKGHNVQQGMILAIVENSTLA